MHFFVDGLGEYAPADVAVGEMFGYMGYGFVVQGIACKPVGDVLHLPAALEGGVHGEDVLVGGVHGGDDGKVGGKFDGLVLISINPFRNITVIYSVSARAIVVSVQKLEDFTEDCRCITAVQFFDNEQALLILIGFCKLQDACERTGNKLVLQLFFFNAVFILYFFQYGHYLADKVRIGIVGVKDYADG